jgi:hypothetical protein
MPIAGGSSTDPSVLTKDGTAYGTSGNRSLKSGWWDNFQDFLFGRFSTGRKQIEEGKRLSATERPAFEIPKAFQEQLDLARRNASQTKYAGQTLDEQNANQAMERVMRQTQEISPNTIAAGYAMGNALDQRNQAQENFGKMAAQNWQQNQAVLGQTLGQNAQWQQNAWEWDKGNPYLQAINKGASLEAAGMQNLNQARQDIIKLVANGVSMYATGGMSGLGGVGTGSQTNNTTQPTNQIDWTKIFKPLDGSLNNWVAGASENYNNQYSQKPTLNTYLMACLTGNPKT